MVLSCKRYRFGRGPATTLARCVRAGLAAASLLGAASAVAQATAPMSLEEAAREAISWHPSIVEAAARLNQQEQRIDEVRAGYYPQVSGGMNMGYESTLRGSVRPRATVDARQRLWDFGKLASEMDAERAGVRASEAQVLLSVDALVRETAYSTIEVLRGLELLDAAREQLESVGGISTLVDARFQRGATTRSDAYQTQARVDAARATSQQIEAELGRWQSNLAYLLGREDAPVLAEDLPGILRVACQTAAIDWQQVPAVKEAEARFEQANANLRRERAERFPTVSLGANGRADVTDPFGPRRSDYSIGLNVTSSIFNGGATGARLRGADHARQAARAGIDSARLDTTRRLAEGRAQVASLEERVSTLDRRHATMMQTRELYSLQYLELGTRTLVDLLNADQELSQIRFDHVNAKYDLVRLGVDCLHAEGALRSALGLDDMAVEGVAL